MVRAQIKRSLASSLVKKVKDRLKRAKKGSTKRRPILKKDILEPLEEGPVVVRLEPPRPKVVIQREEDDSKKKRHRPYEESPQKPYDPRLEDYFKQTQQRYQAFGSRLEPSPSLAKTETASKDSRLAYPVAGKESYSPVERVAACACSHQPLHQDPGMHVSLPTIYHSPLGQSTQMPAGYSHHEHPLSSSVSAESRMRRPCGGRYHSLYHASMHSPASYARAE